MGQWGSCPFHLKINMARPVRSHVDVKYFRVINGQYQAVQKPVTRTSGKLDESGLACFI
jgi:hypothetical protein